MREYTKTVTMKINFGGFIGADKEIHFDVFSGITDDELDATCQKLFEDYVCENSEWEITDITEDEDAD